MPGIFSRKEKKIVRDALWENNPITFQVLGICSALAVTVKLETAIAMSGALIFVLALSNMVISALRNFIPSKIRFIVQLCVISTLVILADQFLQAYLYDISKQLSIFVGLIITNCIVMGRAEGFAMRNPPWRSFIDGLGNALGYGGVLVLVAGVREVLGNGSLLGVKLIPESFYNHGYADCGMMFLAPGAFFLLGAIIWIQRAISGYKESP
ncbi:MAG: NADH:ubiquinone reductase (Na(+)-transporting) subunit D [Candidatus Omnitrophota bacterium]